MLLLAERLVRGHDAEPEQLGLGSGSAVCSGPRPRNAALDPEPPSRVQPERAADRALRVEVDEQRALPGQRERGGDVDGSRRLAHAALAVDDGDDLHGGIMAGARAPDRVECRARGDVAEWLGSGLQSRPHRFDSGRRLRVTSTSRSKTSSRVGRLVEQLGAAGFRRVGRRRAVPVHAEARRGRVSRSVCLRAYRAGAVATMRRRCGRSATAYALWPALFGCTAPLLGPTPAFRGLLQHLRLVIAASSGHRRSSRGCGWRGSARRHTSSMSASRRSARPVQWRQDVGAGPLGFAAVQARGTGEDTRERVCAREAELGQQAAGAGQVVQHAASGRTCPGRLVAPRCRRVAV